jgi:hypothetical protein
MESALEVVTEGRKKRSQSEKIGRIKYQYQLLVRIESRLEALEMSMRTLLKGLEPTRDLAGPFLP